MKFLLTETELKNGCSSKICFFNLENKDINSMKQQLKIIQAISDVELSVKKVTEEDMFEININRYLKGIRQLEMVEASQLLSAYVEIKRGKSVNNLQKSVLIDNFKKKNFSTYVKKTKDSYGMADVDKLVKLILKNNIENRN